MTMTTTITELRPRFAAFLGAEKDLIVIDRLHNCETAIAFEEMRGATRVVEIIQTQGHGYFECDEIGTNYPAEDTQYRDGITDEMVELPARYTGAPALVDGVAGFVLRDHFAGLEAFFKNTNLSDVAALLEGNQASLNTKQANAREQFFGNVSFVGYPLNTLDVTGPEFLVTPTFENKESR